MVFTYKEVDRIVWAYLDCLNEPLVQRWHNVLYEIIAQWNRAHFQSFKLLSVNLGKPFGDWVHSFGACAQQNAIAMEQLVWGGAEAQAAAAIAAAAASEHQAMEQPVSTSTTVSTMPKYDDVMNGCLLR